LVESVELSEAVHPGAGLPALHNPPVGPPPIYPGAHEIHLFGSVFTSLKSRQSSGEFPPHSGEQALVKSCAVMLLIAINASNAEIKNLFILIIINLNILP